MAESYRKFLLMTFDLRDVDETKPRYVNEYLTIFVEHGGFDVIFVMA